MLADVLPFLARQAPGQLVIQYTDRCNARCPQCSMRVTERFERSKLDIDTVKRIIDAAVEKGFRAVSFTGGEPLLFLEEVAQLLKYARQAGIRYTRTGTNGFLFTRSDAVDYREHVTRIAETLAKSELYTFWISLDSSVPDIHEAMRGLTGVVEGIEKALPIFHDHGIYPSANLGITRSIAAVTPPDIANPVEFYEFFKRAFRAFYNRVIEMGFTIVNTCYPMSVSDREGLSAVYGATADSPVVSFTPDEKALLFKALFETIPGFRSKIRIFSPRSALYSLMRQYTVGEDYTFPCRGGIDFFFVDAKNGDTYPCGYRGREGFGKFWDMKRPSGRRKGTCRECDWECFRDPSELAGPLLSLTTEPWALAERIARDRKYIGLWIEDVRYFSACNFFDCGKPPDFVKLSRFNRTGQSPH
jgi:MoaA/NifB/PqqE/SkfB family radical SAM enzyme